MIWPGLLPLFALWVCVNARDIDRKQHHQELARRTTFTSQYTSLVAFGASYQDNAHPRAEQYKQYQRGEPYSNGRFTNGYVFVEHLRSTMRVPLLGYAYGGSVVVNDDIVSAGTPSVADQVEQYLSEVRKGSVANRGTGRSLHVFWAGINDVIGIWNAWRSQNNTSGALANAAAHANRLVAEARKVQSGAARGVSNVDIMILPLPPLETVLNIKAQSSKAEDLAFMKRLVDTYNQALAKGLPTLQQDAKSRVLTYDVQKWWKGIMAKPGSINVKEPCYNSSTGKVCSNPGAYFYFDTLHPTTSTFKSLAKKIAAIV